MFEALIARNNRGEEAGLGQKRGKEVRSFRPTRNEKINNGNYLPLKP